ncbi:MAG: hypothetical protein QOH96_2037 [Blastocatellia bacterium]|nr:hypothetical protein [Blastocatellia bacterium]
MRRSSSSILRIADGIVLAISIWNDPEAKTRADSLGARLLIDKVQLFSELTRSIKLFGDSK